MGFPLRGQWAGIEFRESYCLETPDTAPEGVFRLLYGPQPNTNLF